MSIVNNLITASFTVPEEIGVTPQSMLLSLPLIASLCIVYKATKIPKIKFASFVKEVVILFGSIVVFMAATALVLGGLAWLITE